MAQFNLLSSAAAVLADLLSQEVQVDYPEGAFVAGLLHDLGVQSTAVVLPHCPELARLKRRAGMRPGANI